MGMSLGLSIGLQFAQASAASVAPPYEAEAIALFARMAVQPDTPRKGAINALIERLKTSGAWAKMTGLWVLAAHDAQPARRNWIADIYNATAVASPAFAIDRGYKGDGSNSYLTTGLVLPDRDDNHVGLWSLTGQNSTGIDIGSNNIFIGARSGGGMYNTRNNTGSSVGVAVGDSLGHYVNTRSVSTEYRRYKDAVALGASAEASIAPGNQPVAIGARGTGVGTADSMSPRQIAIAHAGLALTDQQVTDMRAAFLVYLQAVGAV